MSGARIVRTHAGWLLLTLLGSFGALAYGGCRRTEPSQGKATISSGARQARESVVEPRPSANEMSGSQWAPPIETTWAYEKTPVGPMNVVISVPSGPKDRRYPVLIAMHGRGEALKGPERGARGFIDDYWLNRGLKRLADPPLKVSDFLGFEDEERVRRMNGSLAANAYGGLIIVMPYTPDVLRGAQPFDIAVPLAAFLVDQLLPRVYRETPAIGTPAATGIDGISLGGRAAIAVGLQRAMSFGAVAAMQAAFGTEDALSIAERARAARSANPGLKLRLVTTDRDYFLDASRAISGALGAAEVEHDFLIVAGPHDYEFNRGPGLFEMLLFHDRVLRGEPTP